MNGTMMYDAAGKRAQTKQTNRKAILDAARQVFARTGYEAASIRDIIRETSLASGTFYNYFKSKEDVFDAIADDSVRRFRPLLKTVRDKACCLETYLCGAYATYFQFVAEEARAHNKEFETQLLAMRNDTPEMTILSREIQFDLERVLHQSGFSDFDSDYLSAAAIGIARSMGERMLTRHPVDPQNAADFATRLTLAGIKALAI